MAINGAKGASIAPKETSNPLKAIAILINIALPCNNNPAAISFNLGIIVALKKPAFPNKNLNATPNASTTLVYALLAILFNFPACFFKVPFFPNILS